MRLPKSLTTVTPFTKFIALLIILLLPFCGFYAGLLYAQHNLTPVTDLNQIQYEKLVYGPYRSLYPDNFFIVTKGGNYVIANKKWEESRQGGWPVVGVQEFHAVRPSNMPLTEWFKGVSNDKHWSELDIDNVNIPCKDFIEKAYQYFDDQLYEGSNGYTKGNTECWYWGVRDYKVVTPNPILGNNNKPLNSEAIEFTTVDDSTITTHSLIQTGTSKVLDIFWSENIHGFKDDSVKEAYKMIRGNIKDTVNAY